MPRPTETVDPDDRDDANKDALGRDVDEAIPEHY